MTTKEKWKHTPIIFLITIAAFLSSCNSNPAFPEELSDDHIAIMTIALEAQGEGLNGQIAVGEVIRNRAFKAARTFSEVCLARYQFSCWNALKPSNAKFAVSEEAYQKASKAWEASKDSNLTHGATHYLNTRLASPKWAKSGTGKISIGNHTFMRVK